MFKTSLIISKLVYYFILGESLRIKQHKK